MAVRPREECDRQAPARYLLALVLASIPAFTPPRALEPEYAGALNIVAYGADPTGVRDSRAAIQAAIDADPRLPVLVPAGHFRITGGPLDLSRRESLTFVGLNRQPWDEVSVIWVKEVQGWLFVPTGTWRGGLTIEGLVFDGSNGAGESGASDSWMGLLRANAWRMLRVRACNVRQSRAVGAIALDLAGSWEIDLEDDNLQGFWQGLLLTLSGTSISVHKLYLHYAPQLLEIAKPTTPIVIRDTIFEAAFTAAHVVDAHVVFDGCHFEELSWGPWTHGVSLRGDGSDEKVDTWFNLVRSAVEIRDSLLFSTHTRGAGVFRLIGKQRTRPVFTFERGGFLRLRDNVIGGPILPQPQFFVSADQGDEAFEIEVEWDAARAALDAQSFFPADAVRASDRGWLRLHLGSFAERRASITHGLLTFYGVDRDPLFPPPPAFHLPLRVGDRAIDAAEAQAGRAAEYRVTRAFVTETSGPWDLASGRLPVRSTEGVQAGDRYCVEKSYLERSLGEVAKVSAREIRVRAPGPIRGDAGVPVYFYRWEPVAPVPASRVPSPVEIPRIAARSCADITVVLPGARPGAGCAAGAPPTLPLDLVVTCRVTGADALTYRICNIGGRPAAPLRLDLSAGVFPP